ncbi:MAG: spore cortex biosynthesis protein YabQ [Clostridia bacterium]|nr:spore cortex biosynthesis protein YabQ [Clostridia bacterium]
MDMEFLSEIRVFCLCGLLGVACGILYDIIRIIRRVAEFKAVGILIMDILFWVLCACLTFSMLIFINYGRLRWYEWAGIMLGAGSYFLSASPMVTDGGTAFLKCILRLILWLISPVFLVLKGLKAVFGRIKGKFSEKIAKNRLTMGRFWFRIKKRMIFYKKYLKK